MTESLHRWPDDLITRILCDTCAALRLPQQRTGRPEFAGVHFGHRYHHPGPRHRHGNRQVRPCSPDHLVRPEVTRTTGSDLTVLVTRLNDLPPFTQFLQFVKNELINFSTAPAAGKPVFYFDCAMHAREWVTPAACVWMVSLTQFCVVTGDQDFFYWLTDQRTGHQVRLWWGHHHPARCLRLENHPRLQSRWICLHSHYRNFHIHWND